MPNSYTTFGLVRKLLFLTLLGFCVVMLGGPVLALLSVALSFILVAFTFALIGFLAWALVRFAVGGKEVALHDVRELGGAFGTTLGQFGRFAGRALRFPLGFGKALGAGVARVGRAAWHVTRVGTRVVGEVGVMTVTGLLVGGAAELFLGPRDGVHGPHVPVNLFWGAAIGFLVGVVLLVVDRRGGKRRETVSLEQT